MSIQIEIEDLATEFAAKPATIVITYEGPTENGVDAIMNFTVDGFDPVEAWIVLQDMAMAQYSMMSEEEQEECDEWFEDDDEDD